MAKSGASTAAVAPPAGSGKVSGMGEAFSLDLNSGQCNYNIAFDLPEGVAGHRPVVKLIYSHHQGNGVFGRGWALQQRTIERRLDLGDDEARYLDGDVELRQTADGAFHPVRETTFSHYQAVGDHWEITEKDGSRYIFGQTPAARVADPDHPDRIQTWLLERHEDVNGNAIDYRYTTADDGYPYLDEIRYARFVVRFEYEARPDVVIDGRAGFIRRIARRCRSINLHMAADDRRVRSLALHYTTDALSQVSLLTSTQLTAYGDGQSDVVKNPVTYSYSTFDPERFSVDWVEPRRGDAPPPPLTDPETALIALDDLPLPGIVANRNGRHYYWPNNGEGGWGPARPVNNPPFARSFAEEGVQFVDMDGTGSADMLVGIGRNPLNGFYRNSGFDGFDGFSAYPPQSRRLPPFESGRVRVSDLDGDGVIDALYSTSRGLASYRNRGREGWAEPAIDSNHARADFADPLTFMADMTGDGLQDIVRVRSGRVEYWVNLGRGRFSASMVMHNSPRLNGISRDPGQVLLLDVTGDGCSDLVIVSGDGIQLYVNQSGAGFRAEPVTYPVLPPPIAGSVRAVDMDGRGMAGLLYNSRRGGETAYVYFSWDQATAPYLIQGIDNGTGLVSEVDYTPMVEMALQDRAEGNSWDTYMPFPLWLVSRTRETDTTRSLQTEVRYRYHNGHFDPQFRRFQGFRDVDKVQKGDVSRADVLTRHRFLMNQSAVPGHGREHAHLDRLLSEVAVFSLDGASAEDRPLRRETTDYQLQELDRFPDGTPRVFVAVRETQKQYTERSADERIEQRQFEYDNAGNVIRETTRGRGTEDGAAVAEKQVITDVSYATDASRRVYQMAGMVKRDSSGNIIAEIRRTFDDLPQGQLSRGLMTREQHLVLSQAAFDAHYAGMDPAALGYTRLKDADGNPAVFATEIEKSYTAEGNVESETTGTGRTTTKVYDADHLYVIEEDANGKVSQRSNDPVTGKPVQLISASGARVHMDYDAFGRITAYRVDGDDPQQPTRSMRYDDTSVPNATHLSYRIDAQTRSQRVTYYDGQNRELQTRVEREPGDIQVSGWIRKNPWGQTREEFEPTLDNSLDFSVPDTTGRPSRQVFFDGEGRPVRSRSYNGAESRVEFTPFEIRTFDALDLKTGHPQANTPRRERVDVWNHRTLFEEMPSAGETLVTRYRVGLFGELLELFDDAGSICTYRYDRRGNLLELNHRDAGRRRQWFNSANEIVRTVDDRGNDVTVDRDTEGRVTQVRNNDAEVERFVYDDDSAEADGRLVEAYYQAGHQHFEFSSRGFLTRHRIDVDGQEFEFGYGYNDMGRQTRITYPDGTEQSRRHTRNGLVKRIDGVIDDIRYNARNLPEEIRFANGVRTSLTYEPGVGHIRNQRTVNANGAVLEDVSYTFDELMRITGLNDVASGSGQQVNYQLDGVGQLSRVTGSDSTGNYTHDYSYHNGYNLAQFGEADHVLGYNDPARPDRLTDITSPGDPVFDVDYDGNGNLTRLPGRELSYNFKNQLEQVTLDDGTVVRYDYDYRGNRLRRRVTRDGATDETIYLGRQSEYRHGQFTHFVILDKKRIALLQGDRRRWVHLDPLGSAHFFSDENGTRIAQISYYPFGNQRSRSGPAPLRSFATHDYDSVVNLIYMGQRWYAPELGRFLTPDPLYLYQPERSEGDPVQLRLYTYVGNRPVDTFDPTGLSFWSVFGAIVGVVVGIALAVAVVASFMVGIGWGLLAVAGVIGLMTASYVVADSNQGTPLGEFFRGFMIGLNAGMNATILSMMGPVGAFLGGFVGTLIFLSAFDTIASSEVYQGILGWSNWLMPMSWLVLGLGAIMWILNGLGHLLLWELPNLWGGGVQFFRITGFNMDWSTGMLATRGGWVSNANVIDTAYNMGNFAYVDNNSAGWHMDHEAGHNLNLAVYGSIFHFVGFIHEMGAGAGAGAFAEVLAESNAGGPGMWN